MAHMCCFCAGLKKRPVKDVLQVFGKRAMSDYYSYSRTVVEIKNNVFLNLPNSPTNAASCTDKNDVNASRGTLWDM